MAGCRAISPHGNRTVMRKCGSASNPPPRHARNHPLPPLYHHEPIRREGKIVGSVTSGAYGHRISASLGMGYMECEDGVDDAWLAGRASRHRNRLEAIPSACAIQAVVGPEGRTPEAVIPKTWFRCGFSAEMISPAARRSAYFWPMSKRLALWGSIALSPTQSTATVTR